MMVSGRARRAGLLACAVGLAIAAAVQVMAPVPGPPLYDGVVTIDPYRYLQPTGNEPGGAQGATRTFAVAGDASPAFAIGTPEQPPQAQLIAGSGALLLPGDTTSFVISITPVAPAGTPASGTIVGNVYRVSIVNQLGATVSGLPGKQVTLALRDPGSAALVRIAQFSGGTWQPLTTASAATSGTLETTGLAAFGDFALVGSGAAGGSGDGIGRSPFALVTLAVIVLVLLAGTLVVVRDRIRRARAAR